MVHNMIIVGLTGGIASGKSTVARFMKQAGAHIIDADLIARSVVQPGQPAWEDIRRLFGDGVFLADGTLNRSVMGELVFEDEPLRRQLEAIVHPHVQQGMDDQVRRIESRLPDAVVVKDIPLLLETGMNQGLAEIIVVYVPEAVQLQRLTRRDGLSLDQAKLRVRAQMPMEEKRALATILIDNSHTLAQTREQTLEIYAGLAHRAAS